MRWIRIGLFTVAGILAVVIVAVGILLSIDLGRFKGQIEDFVTDLLGRELRVQGTLHATLGNTIEVYAENAYLRNPEWADEEYFVAVEKLDVVIDLWALLDKTLVFERAEINGADVNLEIDGKGDSSWRFQGLVDRKKNKPQVPPDPNRERRFPLMFGDINITNSSVSFNKLGWDQPLLLTADSVRSSRPGDTDLQIELVGQLNETELKLTHRAWPVENLVRYRDVNIEWSGYVGEISIDSTAWIDNLLRPRRPKLELSIEGPNAEYLSEVLSTRPITTGPMSLVARLTPGTETLDVFVDGTYGEFDIDLEGMISGVRNFTRADVNLVANGPDIGTILRFFGRPYDDVDAFNIETNIKKEGGRLDIEDVAVSIGESSLTAEGHFPDFPRPSNASLRVDAKGPDFGRFNRLFGMPGRLGGEFTASLDLSPQDDGRTLARLDANAPHARVKLQSLISASESFQDSTLLMDISGPDVSVIMAAGGMEGLLPEPFEVSGTVQKDAEGFIVQNVVALVGDDRLRLDGRLGNDPLAGNTDIQVDFRGSDLGTSIVGRGGQAGRLPKGSYSFEGRIQFREEELRLDNVRGYIGDDRDYEFEMSGFISDGVNFSGSELDVDARGTSVAALADLFTVTGLPEYSFDVAANVRRGVSNTYISDGEFLIGNSRITFDGHIGDRPLTDDLEVNLTTESQDLHDVLSAFDLPVDSVPSGPISSSLSMRRQGGDLILRNLRVSMNGAVLTASGDVGDVPSLNNTSIEFRVDSDDLSAALPEKFAMELLTHRVELTGTLGINDEQLQLASIRATLDRSTLEANASFALNPMLGSGNVTIKADSPDLFVFFPDLKTVTVPRVAPMTFTGSTTWEGSYWEFDAVELKLGKGSISLDGTVDGPPSLDRTDLHVNWQASSLRNFSQLAGRELPDQALTLDGRLVGSEGRMSMENFEIKLGPSDIRGQFVLYDREVPHVEVQLQSNLLDLAEFYPDPEEAPEEPEPPKDPDRKVFPSDPLPLDTLQSLTLDLQSSIGLFKTRALHWSNFDLNASLRDGGAYIESFSATGQRGGTVRGSVSLVPDGTGGANLTVVADGDGLVLGFAVRSEEELQQLPVYQIDVQIEGQGASVQEIASNADGFFRMVGSEGKYRAGGFALFTQDVIAQLLTALNPFQQTDPYTNVECVTILANVDDGMLTGKPLLVQKSDKLLILGNAEIDLGTEKLEVGFQTIPQRGLGIGLSSLVNPYIRLSGTLGAPSLALNPERVLVEGGLAVATAGISVLAKTFKDRFLTNQNPCRDAIEEFDEELNAE